MKKLQSLKGFRDFLPSQAIKREWLKQKITRVFQLWGYQPLETPTLESLDLFKGLIGEDERLFFKFKDQGKREIALRYDQTVPACRVVGQNLNKIIFPFKRFQIQTAFRAEKPQKGRYREFLQCDADIFGVESTYADAEVIALSLDIYRQLGFKQVKALINDRKLLKDIPYQALVVLDKLRKIGREEVLSQMQKKGISLTNAQEYLNKITSIKPNKTIDTIFNYLKALGFDSSWYSFESTIIRSFSYSTGPIWEIEIPGFTSGSVLGGERFDKIIETIAGKKIPGTGFGLGFDRTLEALEQFNLFPTEKTKTRALVTVFSQDLLPLSLTTVNKLREKGINSEIYTDPQVKLDKQLKYADKMGVPYALIIGPNEQKKKKITVKDLKQRTQKETTLEQFIMKIRSEQ